MRQFVARARHIACSPYKMRPLADVVRGKDVTTALHWLSVYKVDNSAILKKVLESAVANARDLENKEAQDLVVKEIRVDQGRIKKYFKPAAMGRAMPQRKRYCHIYIVLEEKHKKKA